MNIKNRTYYFYDDLVKLFNFNPNVSKLEKKTFKGINIYYIGCYKKKRNTRSIV